MSLKPKRLGMDRTEFEMLPGGWQITVEEFDEVIEPCYIYLPEELVGTSQKEFSDWLTANGIADTNGLRYPWMAVVREMRKDFEAMLTDKKTIERLNEKLAHLTKVNKELLDERRGRFLDLSECTETFLREKDRLLAEKKLLQDEVASLTKVVEELSGDISDEEILRMVKEGGRGAFFKWYNGRLAD